MPAAQSHPQPTPEYDAPYPLTRAQIQDYRDHGFVKLPGVFSPELLAEVRPGVAKIVALEGRSDTPLADRSAYHQAFSQITNLWTRHASVKKFIFNRRCARIATELMGVSGVRLWHDQALFKEAGGGITHWHSDQFFWPVSNDNTITAWIPLQATPVEAGALQFGQGSHRRDYGRHLGIGPEGEALVAAALEKAGVPVVAEGFAAGDVSFHSGWTFHRADANQSGETRGVMTVIYIDEAMRVAEPSNPFQQYDQKTWAPGCAVGEPIGSPINPVLYHRE